MSLLTVENELELITLHSTSLLKLIVPNLLTLPTLDSQGTGNTAFKFPILAKILSRSKKSDVLRKDYSLEAAIFTAFGIDEVLDDLPVAAVSRFTETNNEIIDGYWFRIDPVHLKLNINDSLLFDSRYIELSNNEAEALIDAFNQHFTHYKIEHFAADRWYLKLKIAPGLKTYHIKSVYGRGINQFLYTGADASQWRSMLNEVQMLFFTHDVNKQREQQNKLPVNSVWLYGGGHLPGQLNSTYDTIYSDELIAKGLALLSSLNFHETPKSLQKNLNTTTAGKSLFITSKFNYCENMEQWLHCLNEFERDYLEPILLLLKNGTLSEFILDPCDGYEYCVTFKSIRYFWKKNKPLRNFIFNRRVPEA